MNKKRARKYNSRRKFFNSEREHCPECGSRPESVENILGKFVGNQCPIAFAHK